MNSLTIEQIEDARVKVFKNASDLIEEAQILFAADRYARSYALAHLACEELSKLMMLARIGIDLLTGRPIDWKNFFKRFRSHSAKLHNMAGFDYQFLTEIDLLNDSDITKYHDDVKRVPELNTTKNRSLYVDVEHQSVTIPSTAVTRDTAESMISLAQERYAFFSPIELRSQGRLAEIVNEPSFGAFYAALNAILNLVKTGEW